MTTKVNFELKEKKVETISKKKATRGKHVNLHKYWKGVLTTFVNKADRRHFLNMMIDAIVTEKEERERRRHTKEKVVE